METEKNQVITSLSWVSRIEDAKESLLRSRWDLIIVDEAHKMSAYSADNKTLAYQLGESLSRYVGRRGQDRAAGQDLSPDRGRLAIDRQSRAPAAWDAEVDRHVQQ